MKEEIIKLDWYEKDGIEFHGGYEQSSCEFQEPSGFGTISEVEDTKDQQIKGYRINFKVYGFYCKKEKDFENKKDMLLALENIERYELIKKLVEEKQPLTFIKHEGEDLLLLAKPSELAKKPIIHFFCRQSWERREWQVFKTNENLVKYCSRFAFWIER